MVGKRRKPGNKPRRPGGRAKPSRRPGRGRHPPSGWKQQTNRADAFQVTRQQKNLPGDIIAGQVVQRYTREDAQIHPKVKLNQPEEFDDDRRGDAWEIPRLGLFRRTGKRSRDSQATSRSPWNRSASTRSTPTNCSNSTVKNSGRYRCWSERATSSRGGRTCCRGILGAARQSYYSPRLRMAKARAEHSLLHRGSPPAMATAARRKTGADKGSATGVGAGRDTGQPACPHERRRRADHHRRHDSQSGHHGPGRKRQRRRRSGT